MSLRYRKRKDGSVYCQVRFRHLGKETVSFDDPAEALKFEKLVQPTRRCESPGDIEDHHCARTGADVSQWLTHHIADLTGVEQKTIDEYTRYVSRDIDPILGAIPLSALTEEDIAVWVQRLEEDGAAPTTIANKHGFLSGALAAAVPKRIPANVAAGRRLPRGDGDDHEMLFLTHAQFAHLHACVTEPWQPMVEFLVASGARIDEVLALKPGDVDQAAAEVRIRRAWKRSTNGYTIRPPMTKRSRREINVPPRVLEKLDYTGEWLFTNPGSGAGGPVRAVNFRANVWWPAVSRAWPDTDEHGDPIPDPLRPRIHDLRHYADSWMLRAGVPVPVVSRHLGHESIQVTVDVYGHIDRTSARVAADAIAAALG